MNPKLNHQTAKLGTASIIKLIIELGFPGMLSMFIMALYNVADTFWVAKMGANALAALTVVFPYQMIIVALGAGAGAGFSSLLSRRFGEGHIDETNKIAGQIFPLVLTFGTLCFICTQFYSIPILAFFGATEGFINLANDYLTILGLGAFFTLFSMISNNLFRGAGNAILPMLFMGISAITNIILDPFLIFGIGPFPAMGVKGAAIATIFSHFLGSSIAFLFLFSRHSIYQLKWNYVLPSWPLLKNIFAVGIPTFVMQVLASVVILITNRLLAVFGTNAVATNGLIFRILMMIVMPVAGLSHGLLPIIGFNFGARKINRLLHAVKISSLGSAAFIGVGYIFLLLFPEFWIGLFSKDPAILPMAKTALLTVIIFAPILGPFFMWVTTFQALGKGMTALLLTSSRQFLLLASLLFLPRMFNAQGVWIAFPIADGIAFFIAAIMIKREMNLLKKQHCQSLPITECDNFDKAPLG